MPMKTCRSNLNPYDIFFAKRIGGNHYFVCIYTQSNDINNVLTEDIYGLLITTNQKYARIPKNDYNVEIYINNRRCYVCCDKLIRINKRDAVKKKYYTLEEEEKSEIRSKFSKFINEVERQMKGV